MRSGEHRPPFLILALATTGFAIKLLGLGR